MLTFLNISTALKFYGPANIEKTICCPEMLPHQRKWESEFQKKYTSEGTFSCKNV